MKKAYVIRDKDYYSQEIGVVFAETRGKAISDALCLDPFEGLSFTDLRAKREPALDKYYRGLWCMEWSDPEDRVALVKELDLWCDDDSFEQELCQVCAAKDLCSRYESYLEEQEE